MTLFTRRVITISFILAFFIIAPVTLLYTSGFRYNWQKKKIGEVGVLGIKTYPTNTNVYLNNQQQKNSSPLYINDLAPNVYTVRVELPGYFSWTKNLEVQSLESTLAYDITLFKQSKPQSLVNGIINAYALDHTGEHIAVVRDAQTIEIFSSSGEKQDTLYTSPEKNLTQVQISWSANNSYILVTNLTNQNSSLVVPTDTKKQTKTTLKLAGAPLIHPRFDNSDDEILYGIMNAQLVKISLSSSQMSPLQEFVQSFEVTPIGVITLISTPTGVEVTRLTNRLILKPSEKLSTLPKGDYALLPGSVRSFIAILNKTTDKIWLLNTKNSASQFIELNANTGMFGDGTKNEVFLSSGKEEINVFNSTKNQSTLLGRYAKAPSFSLPLYNTPYYLFYIENKLSIMELDNRDKRNTITLLTDPSISNISMDKLSTKIFYTTPAGLFMLEIQ
ncbi:MAG: hypothetical protein UX10_C0001G0025 [Candidatus Magasanikbacteria bacterium GW2011_GWA2_45_39]|uniref:PEGA domain-containing protein n=2 Tax=Candidatus Magasanikiibacteriota TaxID=1752731 RepID=A0A0G1N0Y9_9BACT|nr:MAG: hypothetical protein UX10_C0001G0025 [Candidatus Magasanikbacteria bacterium GW2011_GWA2_45_39]KKU14286.1 MAG: hypothetical protein UX20_C0002G0023 [Candidatus Magasanikbacteria bacterium GW2011_GWC2_45_8]HBW73988.1 hypothetical protein [Candidatus Magasanikbacteria bacterium]